LAGCRSKYDDRNIIPIIFFRKQNLPPLVGSSFFSAGKKKKAPLKIE